MARPRLPEDQLKNPRRIRKSVSTSQRLPVKPPTKAQRKRWQAILDAAVIAVIGNPETNDNKNVKDKNKLHIFFPTGTKPKDFPVGSYSERSDRGDSIIINAEHVLLWLYERHYTDWTPRLLYASRSGVNGLFSKMKKVFDADTELLYSEPLEQNTGE